VAGHDGGQLDGLGMDGVGGGGRRSTGEGIVRADYKWKGKAHEDATRASPTKGHARTATPTRESDTDHVER
jgi:hypothetical protein